MPLREDLLQPIAGDNPAGKNLRYDRVYDQIKDARTEDDDTLPAGAWERQAKRADSNLVLKLAGETIATRSKDLQITAWLGEAHIRKEGATLLAPVLTLLLEMQQTFWDTLYPEIDEGDVGLRAVPLQWAANRYATLVYELPLTRSGVTYYTYKSARALGYAADAENNEAKQRAREAAIKRSQLTAEDVDEGIAATPKNMYAALEPALQQAREVLEELSLFCEERYGEDGPGFSKLRDSLDEVHNLVNTLLVEKRKTDPDVVAVDATEPEPQAPLPVEAAPVPVVVIEVPAVMAAPVAAAPIAAAASAGTAPPASWDEAQAQVLTLAAYMHGERPGSAVPYLLHSAIRWGEIRRVAPMPPTELLVPPPVEIRSTLKTAVADAKWSIILATSMRAMAEPCARCWLDVHRYLWMSARESGYAAFSATVVLAVQGILEDFPKMDTWTFSDDTPVANADTIKWLEETVRPHGAGAPAAVIAAPVAAAHAYVPSPPVRAEGESGDGAAAPDLYAEAITLAASGQLAAATALLTRDAAQQTSGRMRSQRRVEIAELCLSAGNAPVAQSILREVVGEMEQRRLDTWETKETVARPLALLLRSTTDEAKSADWEARFARLCALDPSAALEIRL